MVSKERIKKKKTTKFWTYVQIGSTLPPLYPSLDKNKFGQVLLMSTLPTYSKSLDIFELKYELKHTFTYFG